GLELPKNPQEREMLARQYFHRLGEANGWHVTDKQWAAFEKTGSPAELPKTLNGELDARKPLKQPELNEAEKRALNAKVLGTSVTEDGVNNGLKGLEPNQRTAVSNQITEAWSKAHNGETVKPEQVGAAAIKLVQEQGDKAPEGAKALLQEAQKRET